MIFSLFLQISEICCLLTPYSAHKLILFKGWRMVKSKTRQDAEILVTSKNPSPRLLSKKFRHSKKGENKPCKNKTSRLIKHALKISRSCQNFPRPTFFKVPFTTPLSLLSLIEKNIDCSSLIKRMDHLCFKDIMIVNTLACLFCIPCQTS